ncbi:MAG: hypothetical protein QQN41_05765 [Nitrosopumilus sp.]
MKKMILDPKYITRDNVPVPDEEKLNDLILKTFSESEQISRDLSRKKIKIVNEYFSDFLKDSLHVNSKILLSMSLMSYLYLSGDYILLRSFLEIYVDMLWVYSIYLDNNEYGENLSKRFYQIGRNNFIVLSQQFPKIIEKDPFFRDLPRKQETAEQIKNTEKLNIIVTYDHTANIKVQRFQKRNWRALPELFIKGYQINFKERSKVATEIACNISNLKAAPFHDNWKILNNFTHWTPMHFKGTMNEEYSKALHLRILNTTLSFLHDMLNIGYDFLKMRVPQTIQSMRHQFIYFST